MKFSELKYGQKFGIKNRDGQNFPLAIMMKTATSLEYDSFVCVDSGCNLVGSSWTGPYGDLEVFVYDDTAKPRKPRYPRRHTTIEAAKSKSKSHLKTIERLADKGIIAEGPDGRFEYILMQVGDYAVVMLPGLNLKSAIKDLKLLL